MNSENKFEVKDLYPEEISNYFIFTFISIAKINGTPLKVEIYNHDGESMFTKEFFELSSYVQLTVKTGNLFKGEYHVRFMMGSTQVEKKIIVNK